MSKVIETALIEYGKVEIPGSKHSAHILEYFAEIGHSWVKDDETPWCAAFVNWVLKECNIKGTGKLNARSFLTLGTLITDPKVGDIVVLWRGSKTAAEGHVGFFITERDGLIYILGGNQSDKVCVSAYPKTQLLAYRRVDESKEVTLSKATLKELIAELQKFAK